MTNLNIWAIQNEGKKLEKALDNVTKEGLNLLYRNCISKLTIGNNIEATRQFDTCLYSEVNDLLIMLMRNGERTSKHIKQYLNDKGIVYHEIKFSSLKDKYKNESESPELWFVNDKRALESAIKDSKNNGFTTCSFYPNVNSDLSFCYRCDEDQVMFEQITFKGLVIFPDKVILFTTPSNHMAIDTILDDNINLYIDLDENPELFKSNEKGCKTLCKKI